MEKWIVHMKKADFAAWSARFHISPVTARIIRNRGIEETEDVERFLRGGLEDCPSPFLLKDMERAVNLIPEAIGAGKKLRVIGDYDVDGICSSYILTKGLSLLGALVDTAIPHRIHDGYGLNEHLIEAAAEDGVEMIVTCDNGIAAAEQIALAAEKGIPVIVTDHHEVPFREVTARDGQVRREELLPPAAAVIDPKQEQCRYPFPGICGAVVAFKVMQALQERTGSSALQNAMDEFLEFAAIATVCDVMELKQENRILVKEGLKRLANSHNPGLRALMEVNEIDPGKVNGYQIGFVLGPCLNATGRLDTAQKALELLQTTSREKAIRLARELKQLNDTRKQLTLEGIEEALNYIAEHCMDQDRVLVLYLPRVHESLAGIIAGRIREHYYKPVFVLTKAEQGVKGSGRSIEEYHMYRALNQVEELLDRYGGHAMAAGLSLSEDKVETLRRRLNENCQLTEEDLREKVTIDVPMPMDYAGMKAVVDDLEVLEPFGVGNPKPLFAQKDLRFIRAVRLGANRNFARFTAITPDGNRVQMIYFGNLEKFQEYLAEKYGPDSMENLYAGKGDYLLSVVYQPGKHVYQGLEEIEFRLQYYC